MPLPLSSIPSPEPAEAAFDGLITDLPLGSTRRDGRLRFRLFAPRARAVTLRLCRSCGDEEGPEHPMLRGEGGTWTLELPGDSEATHYCYLVDRPRESVDADDPSLPVADPYAHAVATRNTFRHEARSLLPPPGDEYDWEGDEPVVIRPRDLVISEMHVRDASAHSSSGVPSWLAGTYRGFVAEGARAPLARLVDLGINAVEFLPLQQFARIEPPYHGPVEGARMNTWNPYAFNHWGYMTSYFFAPEPSYATGSVRAPGLWNDTAGRQVRECRDMVKTLHRRGIAVIMDVVYNHTSHYDLQSLKQIDTRYYYRMDAHGALAERSGCGNDFHTERPMARRLIIDSVLHWMRAYHIDGFRFDLATMIDQATFEQLAAAARALNPDVILIAEPWGGGMHDIRRFSALGIGAWNDLYRNGVKGADPRVAPGYIFGTWGDASPESFGQWVLGSVQAKGGPFLDASHAVNYLASHDGYTLGDFIRITLGDADPHAPVADRRANARLTPEQLRVHKLAALMLCASQGAIMLEEGQEWARSKVIAERGLPGTTPGRIDHNSYEKDDETNWLNYDEADANAELTAYYRGLLRIRAALPGLRHAAMERYRFLVPDVPVASGFIIAAAGAGDRSIAVLVNGNSTLPARYEIPDGAWELLADGERSDLPGGRILRGPAVVVPPQSGMIAVSAGIGV